MDSPADTLVTRIQVGDQEAEELLVSRYWRSLFFILNRRAQDPDLAADIAQETFLTVITKARNGEIENPQAIAAFIRQVGVNLLIASYRKDQRRKTDTCDDIQLRVPEDTVSVLQRLSGEESAKMVKQVMSELPTERDQDLLFRHFVYGQDKSIICQELDLSPAHFDRVLHRARNRLKQLIQHKLGAETANMIKSSALVITLISMMTPLQPENNAVNLLYQVREQQNPMHYSDNTVRERHDNLPEFESFQHALRSR